MGNNWIIGIRSPVSKLKMAADHSSATDQIEQRLDDELSPGLRSQWWPWYKLVDEQYRNWDGLIPDLHRELQQDGGEITDYFVDKFVEIAKVAKPILDDIEGSRPG